MTGEEAIALATDFIEKKGLVVTHLEDARHMKAERFNRLHGYERYKHDFWVVDFASPLPPGVLAETPGGIHLIVEEETRRVIHNHPGWE
jgi:hypothetical protein